MKPETRFSWLYPSVELGKQYLENRNTRHSYIVIRQPYEMFGRKILSEQIRKEAWEILMFFYKFFLYAVHYVRKTRMRKMSERQDH